MTFHSGKSGSVVANSATLPVISWRTNMSAQMAEFRNSKTGSFPYRESTFKDLTGTIVLDLDFDAVPFAAPISILPGATLTSVTLSPGQSGPAVVAASVIVTSVPYEVVIDGKIGLSFDFAVNGSYTVGGVTP